MNTALSPRWMVESYVLMLALLMLGLCLVSVSMPRLRGVLRLCASMMLVSIAMAVLFYRVAIPHGLAFVFSAALLIAGFALLDETMTRFLELQYTERWIDVVLLLGVTGYTFYSINRGGSMALRVELLVLAMALQAGRTGYIMLRRVPHALRLPGRFLAGTFFLFASFCIWRLVIPAMTGKLYPDPHDDQALMIDGTARLSKVVMLCTTVAFGYLWMAALKLSTELDALSLTDPLTATFNRRGLEERLSRELARAQIARTGVALIALDIDHFKNINDIYGHQAGDAALTAFAKIMSDMLRPGDALGRFGGEEFVAILPNADEAGAALVAERLRSSLTGLRFDFDPTLRVTASFGVSVCEHGDDDQTALRRCDKALYAAKQRGRNRVITASQLASEPQISWEDRSSQEHFPSEG